MTTMEIISRLNSLINKSFLSTMDTEDCHEDLVALSAAIEIISAASSGKTYTAFEIIRLVQAAVSDEVCAMDVSDAAIGYEIERNIIRKLVKEDNHEANV